MKKNKTRILLIVFSVSLVTMLSSYVNLGMGTSTKKIFPSYNPKFPPPLDIKQVFELSQDYPDTFNISEIYPWKNIDYKKDYKNFMKSVLNYCLEGNIDVDFKVQENKARKWYHAPWLHYGQNGREYIHGLTRERPLPIRELDSVHQDVELEDWAIGFYNQPGGYTIGKVWNTDTIPSLQLANFPVGTVSFKLLFTNGTVDKVPFLKGTKEWTANIYPCNPDKIKSCGNKRDNAVVRLLQIDIAVKIGASGTNDWVFGTFIYDASQKGNTLWEKFVPVGLMWGDDSKVDTLINKEGAFINPALKETILNADLIQNRESRQTDRAFMSHNGLGGRLNGPIDNPISSCISCHSKAAITDVGEAAPLANFKLTRKTFTVSDFKTYFSAIPSGAGKLEYLGKEYNKLDYSLQLSGGIRNFYDSKTVKIILNKSIQDSTTKKVRYPAVFR